MSHFSLALNQQAGDWPDNVTELADRAIEAAIAHLALKFDKPTELSILLTDDETIANLNAEWRNKSGATNVLSFPQIPPFSTPLGLLGDIILASQTLHREAETLAINIDDHYTHLVIHGFLHILGYDHIKSDEAETMERLECAILARLNIADPYAGDYTAS